jgi:hypothetical protein
MKFFWYDYICESKATGIFAGIGIVVCLVFIIAIIKIFLFL